MKRFVITMMSIVILCLLSAAASSAQEKEIVKKTVTISEDVWVVDTLVKQGVYQVRFDAKNNEPTFFRNGETVASAKATAEPGKDKARATTLTLSASAKGRTLNRLSFEGDRRAIIIGETVMAVENK